MSHYRVSYVESVLRECFIEANSGDEAFELAQASLSEAHHHVVDSWDDDWQAVEADPKDAKTSCYECGAFGLGVW